MMKKHPKARQFALSAVASALLAMPAIVSAEKVNISQKPLLGSSQITPSVVLALSVEFPTTYIAYNDNVFKVDDAKKEYLGYFDSNKCYQYVVTTANGAGGMGDYLHSGAAGDAWRGYLGDGYFKESGDAQDPQTNGGYIGLCPGNLDWSGNMLNWATMSALDIVRQTLTGGNRAKGVGANPQVYNDGDKNAGANKAYLRRSMMWRGQEHADVFPNKTGQDQLKGGTNTQARYFDKKVYEEDGLINKLVPTAFVADLSDTEKSLAEPIVKAGRANFNWIVAKTASGKYYTNKDGNAPGNSWWETTESWHIQIADQVDQNGRPETIARGAVDIDHEDLNGLRDGITNADNKPNLVLWNSGTGFYATLYRTYGTRGLQDSARLYSVRDNTTTGADTKATWFNVVVEKNKKPKGILQEKADMRTAAMGYLPEKEPKTDTTAGDGGVLRAEMRYVMSKEVDSTDDSFRINPDSAAEGNSGVINYLNKFGDNAPYDVRDPVAELYYTAIRYLRYGAWQWDGTDTDGKPKQKPASGTSPDGALPYSLSAFNNSATEDKNRLKDGFPVIGAETGKWPQDPLRERGDQDADMACYAPSIIVLGDTNTHDEKNLPNYPTGTVTDNVASYPNSTRHYYQEVCKLSGFCSGDSGWRVSSGSNGGNDDYAPTFGMAGMAYWVKTNDVRPDISGNQYIDSFFIDVLESNFLKTKGNLYSATTATTDDKMQNSYYLAGKFASPDYEKKTDWTRNDFDSTNEDTRSYWTSDPKGESSDANFPLGMPKNYAVANDPTKVRDALIEAFKVVGFTKNTMQSGIQYNSNGELQIAGSQGSDSLVGSAEDSPIRDNGDGSYTITNTTTITDKAKNGEVPLSLRAGYRFSQRTGYLTASVLLSGPKDKNGVMSGLVEVPVWEAGNMLYTKYHKAADYESRKNHVYSKTGTGKTAITTGFTNLEPKNQGLQALVTGSVFEPDENGNYTNYYNDSEKLKTTTARNAENLIKYILGDPSNEGEGGLRQRRDSLLGTSVYSSVTPILKNTEHDFVRTVPLGATNEKTCYYSADNLRKQDYAAMSSNEGMLHIFDMAGNEVFAYMPQTALPYIANFASPDYEIRDHRFVNDGTSVLHEVCEVDSDGKGVAKTYLVGTSGRGASSIYAIDVTDDNFDFNDVKLEINAKTDSDIGILVSGPLVVNDGTNTPVLIFSSGYNAKPTDDAAKGYLFFYKLNGEFIKKVPLGSQGVGAPFGYDSNGDGVVDRIYVGDHDGNIWRVNSNNSGTWDGVTATKLFECTGKCQPISGRPIVGKVPNGKVVVLAGTGEYFNLDDMRDAARNERQNYAYGIFDNDGTATVSSNDADLLVQKFGSEKETSKVNADLTYLSITQNALEDHHKGWKLELEKGYVISSDSGFYGPKNQVAVYTATKVDYQGNLNCNVSGDTLFIAVDAQNGGAYSQSLFDVNNDGKFNGSDFVGVASAGAVHIKGRLIPNYTIATTNAGAYARGDDGQGSGGDGDGDGLYPGGGVLGNGSDIPLAPWLSSGTVRRVSWREIF